MTTPAPEKTARRRRPRQHRPTHRARLRLGVTGWVVSWLLPTAVMGGLLLGLSFVPGLDDQGFLTPLIPLIGGAAVAVGIPGTLLVSWLYRHHLNPSVHVLGYALVGLLYGPVVLLAGTGGLMPMLIPLVGFPAGVLLGVGRWAAQPLTTVEDPADRTPTAAAEGRDDD
ncbi:hypothetical protein [Nesterenkonia xinjiangensis]|uniref:Uncharacterized protein n=1 Tax=Nesterenkonia xinjiangensis TaxID=225327 RepID=A0A7Z0GN49_9MICC|nr:hypothetical protein [Nesterenkonia xinjiangensis]NYJ78773.1 hypothetical protein [Nesterenkonia xinjiangensis]